MVAAGGSTRTIDDPMNWLAHLRLAPADPLLRLGNLCGDFVRGTDPATLHPALQRGIAQHRAVDRFVDAHAIVRHSRERLAPATRRFAGVLVDVFFDHFLARDWADHGDGAPLGTFVAAVHLDLERHRALLPPRLVEAMPWLRTQGWLEGYAQVAGIDTVVRRMAGRLSRPSPLQDGAVELRANYAGLEADFAAFWPELVAFAASLDGGSAL